MSATRVDAEPRQLCRFGVYAFDPARLDLRRNGVPVRLQEKPGRVLQKLLEQPGEVVGREELCRHVWPDGTYVEFEASLNNAVRRLREILGDSAETPRFVETVARRGYRFMAPAEWLGPAGEAKTPPTGGRRRAGVAVAVAAVGLSLLAVAIIGSRRPAPHASEKVLIAVLPFAELGGDASQEYFADGLTEEMIAQLGRLEPERLAVIARTSVMRYKATQRPSREIGRELGVAYLLEGGVRRADGRVRVTARLVDAASDTQRWSESYERGAQDVLGLQSDLARAIAQEIRIQLSAEGLARLAHAPPLDPLAHDEYLKGRQFWNRRTPEDLRRALTFFQMALARDGQYASAQAGVADAYLYLGWYGFEPPRSAFPRARAAAEAALRSDPAHAGARAALGATRMLFDWDLAAARADLQHAIRLNPSYATVRHWYGFSLAVEGRHDEAIAQIRQGVMLDPLSPGLRAGLAYAFLAAHRYDEASEECRRALELDAGHLTAYKILGWTYEEQGRFADALRTFDEGESATGLPLDADRARTLALAGRRDESRRVLGRVEAAARKGYVPASYIARVRVALGETDAALALLETALADRAPELVHPRFVTEFAPLAAEPRFVALRRQLGR
ncbi:MAG: winged helix-turn-helix domain-containing tetratricopeptide repeat protein [Burkholderiales bacterium]|jgi:TolB-like protein/DNA-binding winged helix-turn-helix (wHTH) protein